ncbi:asparagine synthetase [Histoplasma capsulatum H143]|uniref:asparagine synthase (glutamine-hydrolyzing) n=1 Tax=Ajellomyces capsulatus (strain H143) TaxID=544712 RepID=C6H821_AJECH|nr:asparagine synthetase [Histoplasma capsulatum H143]
MTQTFHPDVQKFKPTALRMAKAIRHRGPDWSGNFVANDTILAHERLSIVGVDSGAQPLVNDNGTLALAVNGEIYNHRILRKGLKTPYNFKTHSDCEVIIPLYLEHGVDTPKFLDGMFSWVLFDKKENRVVAARDPIGITSFYQGWSSQTPGAVYFASELKSLHPVCDKIMNFPPGHVYDSKANTTTRYFEPKWWDPTNVPSTPVDYKLIRESLEKSVRKRLMAEVPYGVLLSGGLDSSLVAAIAQRETQRQQELSSHPVANGVDGVSSNSGLIGLGVKMVLSGEGSDEIFGGYLYFHAAPSKEAFHDETVSRVKNLHLADCLRANKSTSAWGVEARVPFLDKHFLEVSMGVDPQEKMITKDRIEKYILRKAFDTSDDPDAKPYLPDSILWRQKEQFSDGVGYGWIDALKDNAELHVTDEMMKNPKPEWGDDVPDTKEGYWYRMMFDELFPPYCASTVMRWTPTWSKQTDPSGRAVSTHIAKYESLE